MDFHSLIANPLFKAAVKGVAVAAVVDYHAFLQFHSWSDVKNFDFKTALFRWFQGAVVGVALSYGWS